MPASDMKVDTKILNKLLANGIPQHIKRIIHHNHVRFIVGVQGWVNIWKCINRTYHINWSNKKNKLFVNTAKHFVKLNIHSFKKFLVSLECMDTDFT